MGKRLPLRKVSRILNCFELCTNSAFRFVGFALSRIQYEDALESPIEDQEVGGSNNPSTYMPGERRRREEGDLAVEERNAKRMRGRELAERQWDDLDAEHYWSLQLELQHALDDRVLLDCKISGLRNLINEKWGE